MDGIVFTAHGALGAFDELIFLGVAGLFLVMMGVSWFRSRDLAPELEAEFEKTLSAADESPAQEADIPTPDRFRLD